MKPDSNRRWKNVSVFAIAFVWFGVVTTGWSIISFKSLNAPVTPENHDGVFYDNIALCLEQGHGFQIDFMNEAWRERYRDLNRSEKWKGRYNWVMRYRAAGATAMRSPTYPVVLGAIYSVVGWRYDAVRIVGTVLVALGMALLASWIWRRWGPIASVLFGLTASIDFSIMQSAGTFGTESLGILLATVTFVFVVRAFEKPSLLVWGLAGVAFGLLTLTRGNWNLALVIITVGLPLLAFRNVRDWLAPTGFRHLIVFLLACSFIAAPWWIRNCLETRNFQPFGTAGSQGLVAAYCDESFDNYGNWQQEVFREHQRALFSEKKFLVKSLAEREATAGRNSTQRALSWSRENWIRLPQLAGMRFLSHWGLTNHNVPWFAQAGNIALLLFAFFGLVAVEPKTRKVLIIILVLDAMVVMLTWAHFGRYAIPIRPLIHLSYAVFWTMALPRLLPAFFKRKS